MAQFMARIRGQRGEASRLGSKKSGLLAHINGWDLGIQVQAYVGDDGTDRFCVTLNGGSHGAAMPRIIGTFSSLDLKKNAA